MNNYPLVSVIIPAFNAEKFILPCIQSVLSQTYDNFELIIIDDGSTDRTRDCITRVSAEINLIAIRNQGACTARNFGILASKGELIAFLDADDLWLPNKLELQVESLSRLDVDLVYCDMTVVSKGTQERVAVVNPPNLDWTWFANQPARTPFSPSTVLLRRELLAKTGIWNTALNSPAEDFDLFRRCLKFGSSYKVCQALVIHADHPSSLTASNPIQYWADNYKATKTMLTEDFERIPFFRRMQIRIEIRRQFMWHGIKTRNIKLVLVVLRSTLISFK